LSTDLCAFASFASASRNEAPRGGRNQNLHTWKPLEGLAGLTASANLSSWSRSGTKRFFDCICVVAALPMVIPALLLVALMVGVTSRGPILFRQKRVGCGGRLFTIVKFRTLEGERDSVSGCQRFTTLGRWLRRWKLDELPQLLNVILGDMSLVGPRPKMREYEVKDPNCRPGITGAATIVFGREEELLEQTSRLRSAETYSTVVMPAKLRLDAEYMAQATFVSDLRLLLRSVLRRWDMAKLQELVGETALHDQKNRNSAAFGDRRNFVPLLGPALPKMAQRATAEAASKI
jgi:lipopolysaccharide/colanic/teichoic acid biosynthesis glycosyltransferase